MIDLKLNKKRLDMHWSYYRWRYVVFLVIVMVAVNLLYTTTAPQTPATQKVEIVAISSAIVSDSLETWQDNILSILPPDQKEVTFTATALVEGQESTIYQLVAARMAAHEGMVWILPADMFKSYAASGAFVSLDSEIDSFNIPKGTDLSAGKTENTSDGASKGTHQFGIPLDKCLGLSDTFVPTGMVVAFTTYSDVNYDNAKIAVNWLLSKTELPTSVDSAITVVNTVNLTIAAQTLQPTAATDWQKQLKTVLSTNQAVSISTLPFQTGREYFVSQLLKSRAAQSQTGSVCIVPHDVFVAMARTGALRPLDSEVAALKLPASIDLSSGKESIIQKDKTLGATQLYGIPLDQCAGISDLVNPTGMVMVFPVSKGKSLDVSKIVANWILTKK